jgi:16S rRNA (guanine966-N2)-methyltransferase
MPSKRAVRPTTSAGRVIAGTARGIRLVGPGEATRPLGDRVKQALFAILEPELRDRAFLDLYAGSGAAGIEALSRGASRATFVENNGFARSVIDRNLEATDLAGGNVDVSDWSVSGWLARESGRVARQEPSFAPFAVVFADPPYDEPVLLDWALEGIAAAGPGALLDADGVLVAKHFWKTPPAPNRLLRSVREERFGETTLTFYRWATDEGEEVG